MISKKRPINVSGRLKSPVMITQLWLYMRLERKVRRVSRYESPELGGMWQLQTTICNLLSA